MGLHTSQEVALDLLKVGKNLLGHDEYLHGCTETATNDKAHLNLAAT